MSESPHNSADYAERLRASQPRLRAYLRPLIFDAAELDSLLRDIASAGEAAFGGYDPGQPFDEWLMGVARNHLLQLLDNPRTRPKGLGRQTLAQLEAISFQAALQAGALQGAMEQCLPRLATPELEVIHQRFKPGATNASVAELHRVHELKVSQALNQAFTKLLTWVLQLRRGDRGEAQP